MQIQRQESVKSLTLRLLIDLGLEQH